MVIISADSLTVLKKYHQDKLKLKIFHFCPLDGLETDPKCRRIVVTTDCSQQTPNEKYLIVVFYGCYAKTPFKKSALKTGQLFTLQSFQTAVVPKKRVFKCNGQLIEDFYEPLVLVKPDFDPTIKMLVSLREENFVGLNENESTDIEDNATQPSDTIKDTEVNTETDQRVTPLLKTVDVKVNKKTKSVRSPVKKRLKFGSSDEETDISSDDSFETDSRRAVPTSKKDRKKRVADKESNKKCVQKDNKTNALTPKRSETNESPKSSSQRSDKQRRHEYKTLLEVHSLMPVSGKTFCHIYGVLRYRDFKQNTFVLRDEKAYTFTIHLRPGNSTFRDYPSSRPGDIIRIHRILLAPNTMDIICTDPKDVVVFEAFDNSDSFSPIHSSLKPTFDDFDKNRKQELEEWFSDELMENENFSEKKSTSYSVYTDIAVQVIKVSHSRERTYLQVWDTTRPALKTTKHEVNTYDMNLDESQEELVRIINENQLSITVTAYEQHSNDAQSLKPFDTIVLFNVTIRPDRYNKDCYTYSLNSGYNFGKCIRFVKPESCLGKRLFARIEEYKVMSAVNVSSDMIGDHFPSPSLPMDFDETQNEVLREIQLSALEEESVMDEDFDVRCNLIDFKEVSEMTRRKQMFLPIVREVTEPQNAILIDQLLEEGVESQLYKVKARVINYMTDAKQDIIVINCSNPDCLRLISLRQAVSENPDLMSTIESIDSKAFFNCFKCKQNSCLLFFRILLYLEDCRRNKMMAELFGQNAELFLKRTPKNVLTTDSEWQYVQNFFQYFCPKRYSLDSNNSYNILIHWVIEPSKLVERQAFQYMIRTGIAIDTTDKCVGHKLNTN